VYTKSLFVPYIYTSQFTVKGRAREEQVWKLLVSGLGAAPLFGGKTEHALKFYGADGHLNNIWQVENNMPRIMSSSRLL
jgi:hypothetical protein